MERFESEKVEPLREAAEALELPKVLELVARHVVASPARSRIFGLPIFDDPAAIRQELELVSECRDILDRGDDLPLEPVEELDSVLDRLRIPGTVLPPEALVELARVARVARQCKRYFAEHSQAFPRLQDRFHLLCAVSQFEKQVANAIDPVSFAILDSASPTLRRIRRDIESATEEARSRLQQILKKLAARDMLQEQLITVREGRLVLMVKDEYRRKIPGIVHDESASGQTLFLEPMETVEINNRIRRLQIQERQEIERILAALTDLAREHLESLQTNYHLLLDLDALRARAQYSREISGNPPVVHDRGHIVLYAARHPLLLEKHRDPEKVVPLSLQLGSDFNTLVISGPNAGGKTVALKTIGLCVLMVRCGLHIPASADSEIGTMGNVFVDIGDRQSIENDLSTFTSHMVRLRQILQLAQRGDLVLIDEIGSGTDPEEGTAIAQAALMELTRRGVLTVVTTHHGALKVFAHNTPGVENGSMVFDADTLQPTYEFRPGVPGASYAFDIASRIGLDSGVVARARQLVGSEKGELERLISDLEKKIQEQEEKIRKLELEELRLNGLIKLYRERAEALERHRRELKEKALAESEAIIARANAAVEQAIREIREQQASREAIRAARSRLQRERQSLREEHKRLEELKRAEFQPKAPAEVQPADLVPGTTVLWRPQNTRVVILELPDGEAQVYVQAGPLKMRVPLQELQVVESAGAPKGSGHVRVQKPEPVPQELDVRGMRAEEALAEVDRYLSEALLYGWEEVRIIHGKGTGALRKAIAEFLRNHPNVSHFEPAPLGMGDLGVTVVRFK